MQSNNKDNSQDYSKQIDESITNGEERRKKTIEDKNFLSDRELEDISGGVGGEDCPHLVIPRIKIR